MHASWLQNMPRQPLIALRTGATRGIPLRQWASRRSSLREPAGGSPAPTMLRFVASFVGFVLPPVALLADLAITFARGYETTSSLWLAVAVSCGLWLAFGVWQLTTPARREAFRRRGGRFLALTVSLCLGWLLMDACLQWVFAPRFVFHLAPANLSREFRPRLEFIRGVSPATNYTTNSLGIRGPEWPERQAATRILCVGGSTTECLLLDDRETWPHLVGESLSAAGSRPFWVGDVGRSGYASSDHLRLLENEALLRQIDALVFLLGINDLQRAMKGRRLDPPFGLRPLFERSTAFRLLDQMHNVRRTRRRHMEESVDGSNYPLRRSERQAARLVTTLPDLTAARAQYRHNLEQMVDGCERLGVRVWFATQPVLWREHLAPEDEATLWLGLFDDGRPPTAWLATEMAAFNDVLRAFCRERKVGLVELDEMNGRSAWFYDDCHFTRDGAREVANRVAAALRAGFGPR